MRQVRAAPRRARPLVLGINAAYHHSSAAIVSRDGILAAVEEERFNRIQHSKDTDVATTYYLPLHAIDYCLQVAGASLSEVDFIAYSFDPGERRRRGAEIARIGPVLDGGYETLEGDRRFVALIESAPALLAASFGVSPEKVRKKWEWVGHHRAHLASAFLASPFEVAAGLVVDGIGEAHTTTIASCQGTDLELVRAFEFPHSIGFVWEVMTEFLGFAGNYDECKVMGLAAWGQPERHLAALRRLLVPLADGGYQVDFADHAALLRQDYTHIEMLLNGVAHRVPYEPVRYSGDNPVHADIASALQALTSEILLALAMYARKATGATKLVMAGGVALNAVANGVIARDAGFDDVWIQPAASDAGTALGAALAVLHDPSRGAVSERTVMKTAYLGPEFSESQIAAVLDRHRLLYRRVPSPAAEAVEHLLRGEVVGWFQGRMEFGPRALGNRSLLADPRRPETRNRINRHVKHRQDFRPFAPTVLEEHASDWFVEEKLPTAARFMLATFRMRPEKVELVPAVVHCDGSSRLQLLGRQDNPAYHELIRMFYERTGIPMILNTSLNDREPIVCTPEDAARCFLKTSIDVMVIGNFIVEGPRPWEREERRRTVLDDLAALDEYDPGRSTDGS